MKVKYRNIDNHFSEREMELIKEFSKFLQKELPLNQDISIFFEKNRKDNMTTGMRLPKHKIYILVKNRLLIDILRTLSHEWVHEYQVQKLGTNEEEKIVDIGGPEENMANILSGIFVKKFVKNFPQHKNLVFGEID